MNDPTAVDFSKCSWHLQLVRELEVVQRQLAEPGPPLNEEAALQALERPLLELSHRFAAVERSDMRIFTEADVSRGLAAIDSPRGRLNLNERLIEEGMQFIDQVRMAIAAAFEAQHEARCDLGP